MPNHRQLPPEAASEVEAAKEALGSSLAEWATRLYAAGFDAGRRHSVARLERFALEERSAVEASAETKGDSPTVTRPTAPPPDERPAVPFGDEMRPPSGEATATSKLTSAEALERLLDASGRAKDFTVERLKARGDQGTNQREAADHLLTTLGIEVTDREVRKAVNQLREAIRIALRRMRDREEVVRGDDGLDRLTEKGWRIYRGGTEPPLSPTENSDHQPETEHTGAFPRPPNGEAPDDGESSGAPTEGGQSDRPPLHSAAKGGDMEWSRLR